jgi:hypothetical protein
MISEKFEARVKNILTALANLEDNIVVLTKAHNTIFRDDV